MLVSLLRRPALRFMTTTTTNPDTPAPPVPDVRPKTPRKLVLRAVDRLPEAMLPLQEALKITQALSVGHNARPVAVHFNFNANDSAVYAVCHLYFCLRVDGKFAERPCCRTAS